MWLGGGGGWMDGQMDGILLTVREGGVEWGFDGSVGGAGVDVCVYVCMYMVPGDWRLERGREGRMCGCVDGWMDGWGEWVVSGIGGRRRMI